MVKFTGNEEKSESKKRVKALDSGDCPGTEDALVHLVLRTVKRHKMVQEVLKGFCWDQ